MQLTWRELTITPLPQVDDNSADVLVSQLLLLNANDPTADIKMFINSPGGSVTAGKPPLCLSTGVCKVCRFGFRLTLNELTLNEMPCFTSAFRNFVPSQLPGLLSPPLLLFIPSQFLCLCILFSSSLCSSCLAYALDSIMHSRKQLTSLSSLRSHFQFPFCKVLVPLTSSLSRKCQCCAFSNVLLSGRNVTTQSDRAGCDIPMDISIAFPCPFLFVLNPCKATV